MCVASLLPHRCVSILVVSWYWRIILGSPIVRISIAKTLHHSLLEWFCVGLHFFLVGDKHVCWRSQILAESQQCCVSVRRLSIVHFVPQVHLSWLTGGSHVPAQTWGEKISVTMEMEMQCAKCEAMEFMLRNAWRRQEQLESVLRITEKHLEAFLMKDLTTKKRARRRAFLLGASYGYNGCGDYYAGWRCQLKRRKATLWTTWLLKWDHRRTVYGTLS